MSWGKYKFKDINEFLHFQTLASKQGVETMQDFEKFLKEYFSKNIAK